MDDNRATDQAESARKAASARARAERLRDRNSYTDLNKTLEALEQAIPWHEQHAPIEAARLLGWRARVLGYASCGADKVLPEVDRAIAILNRHSTTPEIEYEIILQLCQAIRGVRWSWSRSRPHTRELFDLAMRGLALVDALGNPPQQAELYGSAADALVNNSDGVDLDPAPLARRLGTAAEPLAAAEAAGQRAIDLEDGMFFSVATTPPLGTSHVTAQKEYYTRQLTTIAVKRGDLQRVATLFKTLPRPLTAYQSFERTKELVRQLDWHEMSRDARADALAERLRIDLVEVGGPQVEDPESSDHSHAGPYVRYGLYRLWNLGHRDRKGDLIRRICEMYPSQLTPPPPLTNLREEIMAVLNEPEVEQRFRARLGLWEPESPTPLGRNRRLAQDVVKTWLRETRTGLLFEVNVSLQDESRGSLDVSVNVPEYGLAALLADPLVAAHVSSLDTRLRQALPQVRIETTMTACALDTGVPPDTSLTRALSFANASSALAWFGLDGDAAWASMAADDPRFAEELKSQQSRRIDKE